MNKKPYLTPAMELIALNTKQVILTGSTDTTGLTGFEGWGGTTGDTPFVAD